jgi:hypothetical protein
MKGISMRSTSFWPGSLLRRLILLSIFALSLSSSSLLLSQHAYAHTQDTPALYAADYYQYNYYNKPTSFIGVNFTANSQVTLNWQLDAGGDVPAGTMTTDANGGFTFKLAHMPSLPYSTQAQQSQGTLVATDAQGLQASFLVVMTPDVLSNPTNVSYGDTLTISGGGYSANETVNIFLTNADTQTPISTTTSDAQGAFTASFTIPTGVPNHGSVEAVGVTSGIDLGSVYWIVFKLSISPDHGPAGTSITINGSLYTPGGQVVMLWHNSDTNRNTSLPAVTAASDGTFQTQFTVPANVITGHVYTINAEDSTTSLYGYARFTASS